MHFSLFYDYGVFFFFLFMVTQIWYLLSFPFTNIQYVYTTMTTEKNVKCVHDTKRALIWLVVQRNTLIFIYNSALSDYLSECSFFIQRGSDNEGWQREQKTSSTWTRTDVIGASEAIRQRAKLSCSAHLNDLEIFLKNS